MHTKVIIASLICALAANSNVGKVFFRNIEKAGKTNMSGIVCDAPNAENGYFNITTDFANAGEEIEGEYIFEAGTIGEFRIISSQTSSALQARTITRDGSIFVRVTIPQVQGDYKVTFGRFNYYNRMARKALLHLCLPMTQEKNSFFDMLPADLVSLNC